MQSTMFLAIKSALISGLITGIIGVAGYIMGVGDLWKLDVHALLNVFAMSALTSIVSLVKAAMTKEDGTVAGTNLQIREDQR